MRVDVTRSTFRPERGYSGVIVQQGRVQLDADANEATAIDLARARAAGADVIGSSGVPRDADAFAVSVVDGDLLVSPGRLYTDGILVDSSVAPVAVVALTNTTATLAALGTAGAAIEACQWLSLTAPGMAERHLRVTDVAAAGGSISFTPALSDEEVAAFAGAGASVARVPSYTSQPHLPAPPLTTAGDPCPTLDLADGVWAAYLDVWERAVTAREDPWLREPALGGPDTTARRQVVWQIRLAQLDADPVADPGCRLLPLPDPGGMQARAQPTEAAPSDCEVPAGAGYRRLENQLYRVEVHEPGPAGTATFKWSRENGSVVASWRGADNRTLLVDSTGLDAVRGFAPGDRVEVTDRTRELAGVPGIFAEVERVDDAGLHLTADPPARADFDAHAVVRRWDDRAGPRLIERPTAGDGWLPLEDGVEIRFTATGVYRTGDYWLVPARTATGDVEWPRDTADGAAPLVRPPDGVAHHRSPLALIRRDGAGTFSVTDCRSFIPPLTDLHAADVSVYPGVCDLPDGVSVQQTLETLCQQRDLRFHNRHLHGWGIVCGLQVSCGPDDDGARRSHVTVHEGYAIDPAGNDLLQDTEVIDLLALVEEHAPDALDDDGDGEVCLNLSLDPELRTRFEVEPYVKERDPLAGLLTGTLLADLYADCVEPIQRFLETELEPPENEERGGVHPARERLAALTNLMVQPLNPSTGQHVFLSPREHEVLARFYQGLRKLLRSETFCAMFDDARPFPDYPFDDPGLDVLFGRASHVRLRVRPDGAEAYTVGPGLNPARPTTSLNRYDLRRNVLVETIDPLAGADLGDGGDSGAEAVQDVAFSPDGRLIYVIAPTRNEANTFFRAGVIGADGISWQPVVTICGIKLVTLATSAADRSAVYAVGVVDKPPEDPATTRAGIYRITPERVDPNMDPVLRFNAVGHLKITAGGQAFATAADETVEAEQYTRVIQLSVPNGQRGPDITVPAGSDDLAIRAHPRSRAVVRVYTVAGPNPERRKFVVAHDVVAGQRVQQVGEVELDNTAIRLEVFEPTGQVLVTSEDGYSLRLIAFEEHALDPDYLLPLQVGPIAIAAVPDGQRALVLNHLSNTLVTVDARALRPDFDTAPLLEALADYRAAAVEAFVDLLGGFLQYLKDCLCDKFLVRCPDEDADGTLSLACVSIRDRQIYRVCNFSRRRYVKSFPTVEYWLSVVPVLPLLRRAFDEFCAQILPSVFGRYTVPRDVDHSGTGRVRVGTVRKGAAQAQAFDLPGRLFQARSTVSHSGHLVAEDLDRRTAPTRRRAEARLPVGTLVGQPADRAEGMLRDRGFDVRREPYAPDIVAQLTNRLAGLLRTPEPGGEITLSVQDDRVRSFAVSGGPPAVELRQRVTSLTETVAAREAELAELRAATEAQEVRLQEVVTLQRTVSDAEARLAQRDDEIAALRNRLQTLENLQRRLESDVTPSSVAELQAGLEDLRAFRQRVQRFMDQAGE